MHPRANFNIWVMVYVFKETYMYSNTTILHIIKSKPLIYASDLSVSEQKGLDFF